MSQRGGQGRESRRDSRYHRVTLDEFSGESTGFAGIQVQAKIFNLCVKNAFIVGPTQNLETARASKAAVAGDEPGGNEQIVVEQRGLEVVDPRMPYRHAAANRNAMLERYSKL